MKKISICPICGHKESDINVIFCTKCSGKMFPRDGTFKCNKCNQNHDHKMIYKEKGFLICPTCAALLDKAHEKVAV